MILMVDNQYEPQGGPCRRKCDVDMKTMKCRSCGLHFKRSGE